MTMTDRMDEILGSTLYNLYCPACGSKTDMYIPEGFADNAPVVYYCEGCGIKTPATRVESWN